MDHASLSGTRLAALVLLAVVGVLLVLPFFVFADRTNRPDHSEWNVPDRIIRMLCERQEVLGGRLRIPLISPTICNPPPPTPSVTLTASPTSIDAGSSSMLSWTSANVTSCTAFVGWTGVKATSGSESVTPSETTTYQIDCSGPGGVASDDAVVTVVPLPVAPTLTLVKTVTNDNGGTKMAADFQATIDGNNATWGTAHMVAVGPHTVGETSVAGYTASIWGGDCAADGTITLAAGENKTCTITNDDQPGTLIIKKVVTNEDGGTKTFADFSFKVGDAAVVPFEVDGQNELTVDAGTYTITEPAAEGYTTTYENCSSVAIVNGGSATCTITNNDIAVVPANGHIIVNKVTVPTGDTANFSVTVNGTGTVVGVGTKNVTDATDADFEVTAGTYSVSEEALAGWVITGNTCTDLVVAAGETKQCTITNTKLPKLTVTKVVINDNGGTKVVADFPLLVDGIGVTSGVQITSTVGAHTVSETNQTGYTGVIGGDCAADGTIALAAGDVKACTITNNDDVPLPEGKLLITEVLYDLTTSTTSPQGAEPSNEWVELYNGTNSTVDLSGFTIGDASSTEALSGMLPAGKFAFVTSSATTTTYWSIPADAVIIILGDSIGNGLGNDGDLMVLTNAASTTVDMVSWGTNTTAFSPSVPDTATNSGHSIARGSITVDTDTAADWVDLAMPTPGL